MKPRERNAIVEDFQKHVMSRMAQKFKWTDIPAHRMEVDAAMDDAIELINLTREAISKLDELKVEIPRKSDTNTEE